MIDTETIARAIHATLAEQGEVDGSVPWEQLTGTRRRPYLDAADEAVRLAPQRTPTAMGPNVPQAERRRSHRGPYRAA